MTLNAYLLFDGTCRQAFDHYVRHLGATLQTLSTFGEMPPGAGPDIAPGDRDRVMHACLDLHGALLMGSDGLGKAPHEGIKGAYVVLHVDTPDEAEQVYAVLADGAQRIEMPLQQTFWAKRYAMLVDRFGVPWMVNCSDPCQP